MSSVAAASTPASVEESTGTVGGGGGEEEEKEEQDEEAMRAAFAAFMLHGKPQVTSTSPQSPAHQSNNNNNNNINNNTAFTKALRKYKPITNAFHGTLDRDWWEVDDNLGQVMASIANLRQRCWLISSRLGVAKQQKQSWISKSREGGGGGMSIAHQKPSWKGHGFRVDDAPKTARAALLTETDDLELALQHDLLQHERMLAGARKLLHSLGEAQEALGRRLDELLLHHVETYRYLDDPVVAATADGYGYVAFEGICGRVDRCQLLYAQSSKELYRKQSLAAQVFDSVVDSLLYRERASDGGGGGKGRGGDGDDAAQSPRAVAQRVVDQWSRTHRESHFVSSLSLSAV